jgi:hypothetical protein
LFLWRLAARRLARRGTAIGMRRPQLFIFAGLPGVGKSTLSQLLARELHAAYLRIDTIEQALRDQGVAMTGPEGYVVAYKVAADNLRLGYRSSPTQSTRSRSLAMHGGRSRNKPSCHSSKLM